MMLSKFLIEQIIKIEKQIMLGKNLFPFLKKQLIKIEEQIENRNYGNDLNEQVILWDLYKNILNKIRKIEEKY